MLAHLKQICCGGGGCGWKGFFLFFRGCFSCLAVIPYKGQRQVIILGQFQNRKWAYWA